MLNELRNLQKHEHIRNDFIQNAKTILMNSYHKIPYNVREYSSTHLRDLYYVKEPKIYKTKIDGMLVESWKIDIVPKGKYKVYYGVVTAGVRLGKQLKYTYSSASSYPIHVTVKRFENKIKDDFINGLRLAINNINRR